MRPSADWITRSRCWVLPRLAGVVAGEVTEAVVTESVEAVVAKASVVADSSAAGPFRSRGGDGMACGQAGRTRGGVTITRISAPVSTTDSTTCHRCTFLDSSHRLRTRLLLRGARVRSGDRSRCGADLSP